MNNTTATQSPHIYEKSYRFVWQLWVRVANPVSSLELQGLQCIDNLFVRLVLVLVNQGSIGVRGGRQIRVIDI